METRYKMLTKSHPEEAKILMEQAQNDVDARWKQYTDLNADYEKMFKKTITNGSKEAAGEPLAVRNN
jgi:hypothetical protein